MDINQIETSLSLHKPGPLDVKKEYGVLIPLIKRPDGLHIIYELRSKNLRQQPGEVSFPGGKVELGETYKDASIRETMEELLIARSNIRIIGELDYLVSYANIVIKCYVGEIVGIEFEEISPNKDEVEKIFSVPLDFFLENQARTYRAKIHTSPEEDFPYDLIPRGRDYPFRIGQSPIYFYNYNNYIIWGYTAKMTRELIKIIKTPI